MRNSTSTYPPLEDVLAELMSSIDQGQRIDQCDWTNRYPHVEDELRTFFERCERLDDLLRPPHHPTGLQVRCPHCHQPIELVDDADFQAVECGSCGSHFSLLGDDSTPHGVAAGKEIGRFELVEHVGYGQFGSVWRAYDSELDRYVAVKIPRRRLLDGVDVDFFLRDARAAAQLQHPNIVGVHEVGRADDTVYIVSDFVEGKTLKEWSDGRRLTCHEAVTMCLKIARALTHAHQAGVIHRDLKPANVIIDGEGEPHIVDFGLAKRETGEITVTIAGQVLGTPAYMPPEQARGEGHGVDCRADVYSLGVMLFELLTGELPFRGDKEMLLFQILNDDPPTPRHLNHNVPRDLETITLKCLSKEAAKRYDTALALAEDLERYLAGQPINARPISRWERAQRWCRRNPVVASLSTATLLLLLLAAAGYYRETELRRDVESSFHELQAEKLRNSALRTDVAGLETEVDGLEERRRWLNNSLEQGQQQFLQGQEKLYDTYLKLARVAWHNDEVELADFYLEQCPVEIRKSDWRELKRQCRPQLRTFEGQRCVALSADGTRLAAGNGLLVSIWDVATGELQVTLDGHDQTVTSLDFNSDGTLLASGGGNDVVLWNAKTGDRIGILEGHGERVTDLEFGPNGELASASYSGRAGEVILWNVATLKLNRRLEAARYAVFNHDGSLLATARISFDSKGRPYVRLMIVDLQADSDAKPLVVSRANPTCRPAFHPLRNELAISHGDNCVEFWNIDKQRTVRRFSGEVQVGCLTYNSDGNRLAYTGTTNRLSLRPDTIRTIVWNLITGEKERILPWYSSRVVGATFSSDGKQLVTADGSSVKMWDVTPPPDPTQLILADIVELDVGRHDWPQWGGSRARINTPAGTNIPSFWDVGESERQRRRRGEEIKLEPYVPAGSKNIKWSVPLGSQTYGNPVVANGKLFLGTNNGAGYLKRYPSHVDLGVLLCFDEETGEFLWQHSNEKLATGRVHDWPLQGVCSTPMVDGDRLWYVTNRGEVVCLDTEGFRDGEDDGPVTREMVRMFNYSVNDLARQRLEKAFSEREIPLPERWSLRTLESHKHWAITQYINKHLTAWHYDVKLDEEQIVVSSIDGQRANGDLTKEFVIDWSLLSHWKSPSIVEQIRQQFLDVGAPLPDGPLDIQTVKEGSLWTFQAPVEGVDRDLRVEIFHDRISAYMTLANEPHEADVIWRLDMMRELGVSQHNMATCSIITVDGMLFVCTSNGLDESHVNLPAPDAPSFIALDRDTGEVIWTDNSPGKNILHAQWASPSYGVFDGLPQVIFPGGDGWVYSFDPQGDGRGGSKLLWKFDANPKTSKWILGGRGTRNNVIAFPAIYDGLVYIVAGQDPEHGEGNGHLWCIDPKKYTDGSDISAELAVNFEGKVIPHQRIQAVDISKEERAVHNPKSAVVWHYSYQDQNNDGEIDFEETFHRSLSIPVIKDDILYVADFSGLFHCLHAKTGKVYWTYDMLAACWGSALLVDGKVYIGDEDGDVSVFRHWADPGIRMKAVSSPSGTTEFERLQTRREGDLLGEIYMGNSIYMTPIVANNVMYIATRKTLFAIEQDE